MKFHSVASSSKGNAYLIEHKGTALLIDQGLSYREFAKRLAALDETLEARIAAILLTHSHTDHIAGLGQFLKHHPEVTIYANSMTAEAVVAMSTLSWENFICFENAQTLELGPFEILPFSIPHDTSDPVGFLVKSDGQTYFHCTDLGLPLESIGMKLAEADLATLESNHDPGLLRYSGRAPSLIQRIAGPRGHLSNDDAAELVENYASPKLKELYLAHLSGDCNAPHLAEGTMRAALKRIHREDIALTILKP